MSVVNSYTNDSASQGTTGLGKDEGEGIVHHPIIEGLTRYNPLWAAEKLYQNIYPRLIIYSTHLIFLL